MNSKTKNPTLLTAAIIVVITIVVFVVLFIGRKQGKFGGSKNQPAEQEESASLKRVKIMNSLSVPENNRNSGEDKKTPSEILSAPTAKTTNNKVDSKVIESLSAS